MTTAIEAEDMISLPGGRFVMGSDRFYPEERPAHAVEIEPFRIDRYAVSNAQFAGFVRATGYVTTAEQPLPEADMPGAPPEALAAGSLVFHMTEGPVSLRDFRAWWRFIPGACWSAPEGPGSSLEDRWDHPVVHVSLADATAYAEWNGKSLPTEKEWEYAAGGGQVTVFPWGDGLLNDGRAMANTWQGAFPWRNDRTPGPVFSEPVTAYGPTGFGTYNMIGNVWEWTGDAYKATHNVESPCCSAKTGGGQQAYVLKGGSFLCAASYCQRYRPAARSSQDRFSSSNHIGFRCTARL